MKMAISWLAFLVVRHSRVIWKKFKIKSNVSMHGDRLMIILTSKPLRRLSWNAISECSSCACFACFLMTRPSDFVRRLNPTTSLNCVDAAKQFKESEAQVEKKFLESLRSHPYNK